MLFMSPLIGVLLIAIASGLRNCDDCTEITLCKEALHQVLASKSKVLTNKLTKAQCGYMKICCSDFATNPRMAPDVLKENGNEGSNQINEEDEIEHHPNVNLLPDECGKINGKRITGGIRANMNEYPWLALISHIVNGKKEFYCGGTVINERYVLTAAHCIKGYDIVGVRIGEYDISSRMDCTDFGSSRICQSYVQYYKDIVGVRIGEYDISTRKDCTGSDLLRKCQSNLQDIGVSNAIIHKDYVKYPVQLNDIGLLRLKKSINLTVENAGTICLPLLRSLRDMNIAGAMGDLAGWGRTENLTSSPVLLTVEVPVLEKEKCNIEYNESPKSTRFETAFCAGDGKHDSCQGDSGGPFMLKAKYKNDNYRLIQFGIVSYGPSLCGSQFPGIYTDVRKFMKWILNNMKL